MGLIGSILTLPLAPVRAGAWVAEKIHDEALRQWSDPGVIRAELAQIDALRESGEIDETEAELREEELLQRLMASSPEHGSGLAAWEEPSDG